MITARLPENESLRLAELYEYNILDTTPEQEYDDITKIASDLCKMPISVISLIDKDRQWFKSRVGFNIGQTGRDISICAHTILTPNDMLEVVDTNYDERFNDNPCVINKPYIAYYAGIPLISTQGNAMGTLCVMDTKPNQLTEAQKLTLKALARVVMAHMELRRKNMLLAEKTQQLEQNNNDLSQFAHVVAHDIKSPCNSIHAAATILKQTYKDNIDDDGMEMLNMMISTSMHASKMVDGILSHTKKVNGAEIARTHFKFGDAINDLKALLTIPGNTALEVQNLDLELYTSKTIIVQILLNLCTNAIKHNDKTQARITLSADKTEDGYLFSVKDNGPGIPEKEHDNIFELFRTLETSGVDSKGHGIGLATVKRLIEKLNGSIEINSELGKGCEFKIYLTV